MEKGGGQRRAAFSQLPLYNTEHHGLQPPPPDKAWKTLVKRDLDHKVGIITE